MRVQIDHVTEYGYSNPVAGSVQYLRLTPRSGPAQTVHRWRIGCAEGRLTDWIDQYGNMCHTLVVNKPTHFIRLQVSGEVRTIDTAGVIPLGTTAMPQEVYLRESRYTKRTPPLVDFAEQFRATFEKDRVDGLHALMSGLADHMNYVKGETDARTTAAEALEAKKGVCQDFAHVFIASCRHLDVPARYVSGYLAGEKEAVSSHAWAEALVPKLGWVSFDTANRLCATEAYVRKAVGLDYADAGPVRGVRMGGGEEVLMVSIAVAAAPPQQ